MTQPSGYLTPDQIEKLNDGWHVAVVLGPADLDVLHAGLTLDYCDGDTKALWEEVRRQIRQRHFLNRTAELVNAMVPE